MTSTPAPTGDAPSEAQRLATEIRLAMVASLMSDKIVIQQSANLERLTAMALTPPPAAQAEPSETPDEFRGDNARLVFCIGALLSIDAAGALTPQALGGHARTLLSAAASRLAALTPQADHIEQPRGMVGEARAALGGREEAPEASELPHVGADEEGIATLEWWCCDRKLTMYWHGKPTEALLKSWGPNIETQMEFVSVADANAVKAAFDWLRATPPPAPPTAADQADTKRMDWLALQVVVVRSPARYGSLKNFIASPADVEGELPSASDLRALIDAANPGGKQP